MRRIRQDKGRAELGGMQVLRGHYTASREAAEALGYGALSKRDYLCVLTTQLQRLPEELRSRIGI